MWRNSERASLEKKPSMRLSRAMGRREGEGEAPDRLRGEPGRGLARDMGGMVVEDDLDGGVGGVGRVKQLEELDEFAAAVAFLDQGVDVTGKQIDACHQGQRAVALVFVIAHHGRDFCREAVGGPVRS